MQQLYVSFTDCKEICFDSFWVDTTTKFSHSSGAIKNNKKGYS